ncbi:MAG: nuclear transport factor 2 family protein [Methylovulum miyakonense]|uniref:nuclear transport factor 2 family protein n=1 Tax=Methylovulum miyakonense TaxID=645578 RepID=UPI003BB4DD0C
MESNSHQNTWETYTRSWSERDASKRLQLFEGCLSPDCVHTDPLIQATGYNHLSGYMSELHKNVPGVRFVTTGFKNHHDRSLAHWNRVDGDGNILSQGASYGLYGADSRLLHMTGFFESPDADKTRGNAER